MQDAKEKKATPASTSKKGKDADKDNKTTLRFPVPPKRNLTTNRYTVPSIDKESRFYSWSAMSVLPETEKISLHGLPSFEDTWNPVVHSTVPVGSKILGSAFSTCTGAKLGTFCD